MREQNRCHDWSVTISKQTGKKISSIYILVRDILSMDNMLMLSE